MVNSTSLLSHAFIDSCLRRLLEWFAQGDDQKAEAADQRPDHDCSNTWLKSGMVEAPSILLNENGKKRAILSTHNFVVHFQKIVKDSSQ